ncbi:MAG: hypothetical protein KF796_19630 [Ramlibacter sp.]|nr:hypothetical protein [Ramlibacter sp.]
MSDLATIRAAVVAQMAAVPGIGLVHAYERYARAEAKFRELFVTTPDGEDQQIRGWWLQRAATEEKTVSTGTVVNVHTWRWRGYMALNDEQASALRFDELIEAYRDVVRADPTLGGVCEQNSVEDGEDGVQVIDSGPVLFCGVLCHSALLQLKTWSYL